MLEKFVTGIVKVNRPGAQYEGKIYDRNLIVEIDTGIEISIFDPHAISANLLPGLRCEVLIFAFIDQVAKFTDNIVSDQTHGASVNNGIVYATDWDFVKMDENYWTNLVKPEDHRKTKGLIIKTYIGYVVVDNLTITESIKKSLW